MIPQGDVSKSRLVKVQNRSGALWCSGEVAQCRFILLCLHIGMLCSCVPKIGARTCKNQHASENQVLTRLFWVAYGVLSGYRSKL